jgi:hypothetical protein
MPDLERMMQQEPDPTIHIVCRKTPVPGSTDQFTLQPQLTFTHMPGSWATVHQVLAQCLVMVAQEMVKESQGQQRIALATQLPDGSSLVRH